MTVSIKSDVKSVFDVFRDVDAFLVPEYQRSYQWGRDHIYSLVRDIHTSICMLETASNTSNEIRFMGSIITIIQVRGLSASGYGVYQPQTIHQIVDGQQRLSTFALLAVALQNLLEVKLNELSASTDVYAPEIIQSLTKIVNNHYHPQLKKIYQYSKDQYTQPSKFPSIIREESDTWDSDKSYDSPVAKLLINAIYPHMNRMNKPKSNQDKDQAEINYDVITQLLNQIALGECPLHPTPNKRVDEARLYELNTVLSKVHNAVWHGDYAYINNLVVTEIMQKKISPLLNFTRILLFTYYFLNRCYLNHISTQDERWAFDMFIGLNTSGIPLSAVETFKAQLLQKARELPQAKGDEIRAKIQDLFMNEDIGIQKYFDREEKQSDKNKRIKEYVTNFALFFNGSKLGYEIHEQRVWLKNEHIKYLHGLSDEIEKQGKQLRFITNMKHFTRYLVEQDNLINNYAHAFNVLINIDAYDREAAMLAIGFLDDVNHSIVNALLARFYEKAIRNSANQQFAKEFADACLAVTAFFVIWRPIRSTNGLPDIYRNAMRTTYSHGANANFNVNDLKQLLRAELSGNLDISGNFDLTQRDVWISKASDVIQSKRMKDLSKFILLITAHETTKDEGHHGLIKKANPGFQQCATLNHWKSKDLKTIEHIAPQKPSESDAWDSGLYGTNTLFDSLGNLVLMPTEINSSVGNNNWRTKWTYYQYLALVDPNKRKQFVVDMGSTNNIVLQNSTLNVLKNATFAGHMAPIVAVGIDGEWTADLVQRRTRRMLEIFHDRMMEWLS
jgi:hypothetical protein